MRDGELDAKLYSAARTESPEEVSRLIAAGADPNARSPRGDGYTPVIEAAFRNRMEVVRILVEKGADVNARSRAGWTALMSAAWEGHTAIVRFLLEKGAAAGLKNGRGQTALSLAESAGNHEAAALLKTAH